MNSKLICLCAFVFFTSYGFSQNKTDVDITRVTKITFLNPGFSYENRVGKFQSVYLNAYLATSAYFFYSSNLGTSSGIYFDPALSVQYRYYYNAARRESRGKRTAMNSLNYVGPIFDVIFSKDAMTEFSYEEEKRRPVYTFAFVWGIQRNYERRFSLDINLGAGYFFTKGTIEDGSGQLITVNQSKFTTTGNLSLGFWLNKRR
ncbi:MAG TPA: hypothetical protein VGQ09_00220 [Chitinophagaceae bacterium]|jgi:hypothetical protein|nr:hypothetical protein [Chitinophagaceae bacterium]